MLTHPAHRFVCKTCNYTEQVIGSRYVESSCENVISTRKCNSCNRLSDVSVTKKLKIDYSPIYKKFKRIYKQNRNIYIGEFWFEYANYVASLNIHSKHKTNCFWCNSKRTVDWDKTNPICPKCKSEMIENEGVEIVLDKAESYHSYEEAINSASKVIICYMENWCVPCLILYPIIKEIQEENPNEFKFIIVDIFYATKNKLHESILKKLVFPTFLCYLDGQIQGKFSNVDSKPELLSKLRKRFTLKSN